ncbi:hypothetical protein D3C72_1958260 [compost metagenome]
MRAALALVAMRRRVACLRVGHVERYIVGLGRRFRLPHVGRFQHEVRRGGTLAVADGRSTRIEDAGIERYGGNPACQGDQLLPHQERCPIGWPR